MGRWRKPDAALIAEFEAALAGLPGVERRQMFGCPCAFVHGHLFAGVHEDRLLARVPEAAAVHPFAPMGRAMREYAALEGALDWPAHELRDWVRRAYDYASGLPPKAAARKPARKLPTPPARPGAGKVSARKAR